MAFALVPSGNFSQSNSSGASVFPTHGRPLTPLRAERNGSQRNHASKCLQTSFLKVANHLGPSSFGHKSKSHVYWVVYGGKGWLLNHSTCKQGYKKTIRVFMASTRTKLPNTNLWLVITQGRPSQSYTCTSTRTLISSCGSQVGAVQWALARIPGRSLPSISLHEQLTPVTPDP